MSSKRVKVQLMSIVEGLLPCEQTQYLVCEMANRYVFITAYLKGNGYVKLFELQDYIEWEHHNNPSKSIDITFDEFNDDKLFEQIIESNFLAISKT